MEVCIVGRSIAWIVSLVAIHPDRRIIFNAHNNRVVKLRRVGFRKILGSIFPQNAVTDICRAFRRIVDCPTLLRLVQIRARVREENGTSNLAVNPTTLSRGDIPIEYGVGNRYITVGKQEQRSALACCLVSQELDIQQNRIV